MTGDPSAIFSFREALAQEAPRLMALLVQNRQSPQDVLAPGTRCWIAQDANGELVGTVGLDGRSQD
jgi:hypothetical protein